MRLGDLLTSSSVSLLKTDFQPKYLSDEMSQTLLVCRASSIKNVAAQHNTNDKTYDVDKTHMHEWRLPC
jgi:hypothetical protein